MSWKLAYKNLFRNKRRSLSTGLAICVGFVGLNLLGAYLYRTQMGIAASSIYSGVSGHILIYKKDSLEKFQIRPKNFILSKVEENKILEKLKSLNAYIEYTSRRLTAPALLSNGTKSHPIIVTGYEPKVYARSIQHPVLVEWASEWVFAPQYENIHLYDSDEIVSVTPKIAEIMSLKMPLTSNESVQIAARTLDGDLNAVNADLGTIHTTGEEFLEETFVMLPLVKTKELLDTDGVEAITVFMNDRISLSSFYKKTIEAMADVGFPVDVYRFDDELINPMYSGTMGFLYVMGAFFVFLICTAVSLTITNSLTMGIIERTREIGTLRAIGFTSNDVQKVFTRESLVLCGMAMTVGTILSFAISAAVNAANIRFFPPGAATEIQFALTWNINIALIAFVLLATVTWLSSYLVISRKNRVKLISLLNDTGEE